VAAYSPRPGTLSYKWEDDVPLAAKKERLHAVEQLQEGISRAINATYLGRTEEVLVESRQIGAGQPQWRGRNRTNKLVFFPATRPDADGEDSTSGALAVATRARTDIRPGALARVRIDRTSAWSLQGTCSLE
jgi:tRNA-2-methylthio-N6-dimethylallyladenosine synthase